jgi:hypothetical protein
MQTASTKNTTSSQDCRDEPYKTTQAPFENHDYLQKPVHIREVAKTGLVTIANAS